MFRKMHAKFRRWKKIQEGVRELNAMSDRDLADIGVSRYDIERLVSEATATAYAQESNT